jgi:hypothetical protein
MQLISNGEICEVMLVTELGYIVVDSNCLLRYISKKYCSVE